MNFQPIETAPRDGSLIGAWSARERGVIRIVRWGQHLGVKKHQPCWITVTKGLAIGNLPTHWVPVPQKVPAPPPTGGNVEGEKG